MSVAPRDCRFEVQGWGYRDNGKDNGNYREYRGYIGVIRDYVGYILGLIIHPGFRV